MEGDPWIQGWVAGWGGVAGYPSVHVQGGVHVPGVHRGPAHLTHRQRLDPGNSHVHGQPTRVKRWSSDMRLLRTVNSDQWYIVDRIVQNGHVKGGLQWWTGLLPVVQLWIYAD